MEEIDRLQLMQLIRIPFCKVDLINGGWVIRQSNDEFKYLTGYQPNELIGREFNEILTEQSYAKFVRLQRRMMQQSNAFTELVYTAQSGRKVYTEAHVSTFQMGSTMSWLITNRDRTIEHWIENKLMATTFVGCFILTSRYDIKKVIPYGPGVEGTYEHHYEEMNLLELIQPKSIPALIQAFDACRRLERQRTIIVGTINYAALKVTIYPFFDARGLLNHYVFAIHEIQEKQNAGTRTFTESAATLRSLMLRSRVSAKRLSEQTGISKTTISKLLNGKITKPRRLTAELIARELGVRPNAIWQSFRSI
ncbi:PAS domain S-box-containing protein [Paenibacillus cellulosilyticus]|uniref:PAS domain S-box-containing protein n=1 Tax=Paenibacillus cellulosilyticus TaxID=375489 RepID=A0A2V2YS00_9BACL|nr:helix-turn-helix domain-containing protein [Paenibacillus cellulosilyticus]PWW00879.1 PAS domain S-box-containing protein [Paenibacillus cellulosilyticus]QKS47538.1 helix-turn-helix domain-containing protein [Paenibacillus cellulosilyticus]